MKYRVTVLTPTLVGDGDKLSPIDYMVWRDQVNVLDQPRIFKLLSKGPRLEGYLTQLRKATKLDFASWGGFAQNYAGRRIPFEDAAYARIGNGSGGEPEHPVVRDHGRRARFFRAPRSKARCGPRSFLRTRNPRRWGNRGKADGRASPAASGRADGAADGGIGRLGPDARDFSGGFRCGLARSLSHLHAAPGDAGGARTAAVLRWDGSRRAAARPMANVPRKERRRSRKWPRRGRPLKGSGARTTF